MLKSISRQIAEFAIKLKYDDLPKEVVNEVKRYLYDSIGCAYGGSYGCPPSSGSIGYYQSPAHTLGGDPYPNATWNKREQIDFRRV